MPKFIQSLDLNGNEIYNIPTIKAGRGQNLLINAPGSISLESATSHITAETSINITSGGSGSSSSLSLEGGAASLNGDSSTTVGKNSSDTNINAGNLTETSTSHSIITPALNINGGGAEITPSATEITSTAIIENAGDITETGAVEVTGSITLNGSGEKESDEVGLSIAGTDKTVDTIVKSDNITFKAEESIYNNGKLILAKNPSNEKGKIESLEDIANRGNIENTGSFTNTGSTVIKGAPFKVTGASETSGIKIEATDTTPRSETEEEKPGHIDITQADPRKSLQVNIFGHQNISSDGTIHTYDAGSKLIVNGSTNLVGATNSTGGVTIGRESEETSALTVTKGVTSISGGTVSIGDKGHSTTISGSEVHISSDKPLEFNPSITITSDKESSLLIEPKKISRDSSEAANDTLSIEANNIDIKANNLGGKEGSFNTESYSFEIKAIKKTSEEDASTLGVVSSKNGTTTLSGAQNVSIESSKGSIGLNAETSLDLQAESITAKTAANGNLVLGNLDNESSNIYGKEINIKHSNADNNKALEAVNVFSRLNIKDIKIEGEGDNRAERDADGLSLTGSTIRGKQNSLDISAPAINITGEGRSDTDSPVLGAVNVKAQNINVGMGPENPSGARIALDTSSKILDVNVGSLKVTSTSETIKTTGQITISAEADSEKNTKGTSITKGGLDVADEITTGNLVVKAGGTLTAPEGNIAKLTSDEGSIDGLTSIRADFTDHIKIGNIILRYDNTSKALLFEVDA